MRPGRTEAAPCHFAHPFAPGLPMPRRREPPTHQSRTETLSYCDVRRALADWCSIRFDCPVSPLDVVLTLPDKARGRQATEEVEAQVWFAWVGEVRTCR